MRLNEKLIYLRETNELTQEFVAVALNVSLGSVSSWEAGDVIPPDNMLVELSELYNVDVNDLVDDQVTLEATDESLDDDSVLEEIRSEPIQYYEEKNDYSPKIDVVLEEKKFTEGTIVGVIMGIIAIINLFICLWIGLISPGLKYSNAINAFKNEEYDKVIEIVDNMAYGNSRYLEGMAMAAKYLKDGIYNESVERTSYFINNTNYDTNGGSIDWSTIKAYKTGHSFIKWEVVDYEFDLNECKADISVKAVYRANTYYIYYDLKGGNMENPLRNFKYTDDFTIASPTKEGYKFIGWKYDSVSTPIIEPKFFMRDKDIILKAIWEEIPNSNANEVIQND